MRRTVGLPGAILIGLGSILGTGVFASLAIGAGIGGSQLLPALILAGLLATFNGLSSARLAAAFPVSGGTYEYGYRVLGKSGSTLGFAAGWLFLCAKSASCAAAALAFAGYVLQAAGYDDPVLNKAVAVLVIFSITALVSSGLRRGNTANAVIVTFTLAALTCFIAICFSQASSERIVEINILVYDIPSFLQTTALMFVAFTGYGRIATLGEEVREPARTIPLAVIVTLTLALLIYLLVASSSIAAVGVKAFASSAGYGGAALAAVAQAIDKAELANFVTGASFAALCGVQLNLTFGISRVMLAMGRRQDLPRQLARLTSRGEPAVAVWTTGILTIIVALIADLRASWAFSAFTILIYYAVTNLAALQLKNKQALAWRIISWMGLFTCLALSAFVDRQALVAGTCLLAAGFMFRWLVRAASKNKKASS